jgi:glycosyltransferase involved in cell wall biosynthesis
MKVLQVIDTLNVGGAEKMCVQMANLLYEKGHDVSILFFDRTEKNLTFQINKCIPIYYIGVKRNWYNPLCFYRIFRLMMKFEIVHIHMRTSLRIIYLSTLFGLLYKRVVFHDHTGGTEQFESSSKGILIPQAIRSFKYVAVYNELALKSIERFKLNRNRIDVVSNFVPKPIQVNIQILPFNLNNLEILVVGNFRNQKNLLFLISLCNELKLNSNLKPRFHILGSINDLDYYKNFIELIYLNNLKPHFIIHNDVSSVFKYSGKVNLAIMPSNEESGPLVLIEYLILKIPFLAHNVGDVTNKIGEYFPNQVINNLNPKLWVKHLSSISFGQNLAEYDNLYNAQFSDEVAYKKWIKIYKKIIGE